MIEQLLNLVYEKNASDMHISVGLPPIIRVDGKLMRVDHPPLTKDGVEKIIFDMLSNEQRRILEQNWELDCSYGVEGIGRFRINVYRERGHFALAMRAISTDIPTLYDLGIPDVVKDLAEKPRGLILVTGPTGSGKSTTLAAMIDYINTNRVEHIITIEDPIEYLHYSKRSVIHQRELGHDTRSFGNALRAALREDPDIILVGEMRDLETVSLALTAAETGHLVLGTLHTSSASQTIDRIVDVFPAQQQQQIRIQLSSSLIGVLSQTLLPKITPDRVKKGRCLAMEIMIVTSAISNLIREGKSSQIYSSIQTGLNLKMQTLESCLKDLCVNKLITYDDAIAKAGRPEDLKRMLSDVFI